MSWPGILLELGLQPLEQREGVGGRAGEAADDVALAEPAHLAGVALDDGLAEADLAVAADDDRPPLRTIRMVVACHAREGVVGRMRQTPGDQTDVWAPRSTVHAGDP